MAMTLKVTHKSQHPVLRQDYAIYTPPMHAMIETIGDWLAQKVTGGYVYGPSRFGKTRTVLWHLKNVLEERFKNKLPLVLWMRPDTQMHEGLFWSMLLQSTHYQFYELKKNTRKNQLRYLFKQQLITLARASQENFILLMIDEAQYVTLNEWKWLLGLQNELDYEGYRLTIFSIASHQVQYQPNLLARTGNAHIAARFFPVSMRFHGIRNLNELGYVLNGYDIDSEWPEQSGISFLEYFAPEAFKNNCRLANHTDELWQAFVNLIPEELTLKKQNTLELPMQHIAFAVEGVLRELSAGAVWDAVTTVENLTKIIKKTGFTNYYRFITAPE